MATKLDTVVSVILDASGMVVGVKNANGQIRNLQGQFIKLKDDMQLVEKGTERFATAMAQATQKANKSIKDSTNQMTSFKGVLESMFKPITSLNQAFGVMQQSLYIVQRAFALTVGSANELELQVARITTVLDESEVGQVDFAKRILDMQRVFGANPTEAAKGFYEAIASGATNAAGSIDLMATAQKLAVGGLLPLDKALSGLTAVMASYGYEANQTRYISDGFFIAAAKGKTNVEELTMEIGNVSAIAQQANVSFEELVSSVSAVTLGGKRTAEATTSVRSAINALLTPTEQLQYVYDQLGINSVTAAIKQRGLQAVYQDIYKYVNFNVEALSKLVGRIEAVPAVVALTTGKQKAAYNDMLSSITNSTKKMGDTTERAFNIIAQTSAHRMEVAKGSISASLTGISQAFTVILTPLVEVGAKILSSILKPIELASSAFVTFSKSVTDYVIPAVTALTVAFAAIKIPALVSVLTPLAVAFKAVAIPAAIVAGKFLLISAAVVGISALIDSIIRNFNLIPTVFDLVISKFDEFRIYLEQKLYSILDTFVGFGNDLAKQFPEFAKSLGLKFNVDGVKKHVDDLSSELDKAVQKTLGVKEKLSREFKGGAFKAIGEGVKSFIEGMKGTDVPPQLPSMPGMPKPPKSGEQGEAPDIAGNIEAGKKATEQMNAILQGTVDLEKEIALSKVYGNDVLREGLKYDLKRLDAVSQQADAYEKLSSKQLQAIDNYKIKAAEAVEIKINTENLKTATDFVNSATAGADAVVSKSINEIGKMFGPEGQLVASIINLLRSGREFMSKLGSDLIKIIAELPLKVTEGLVGLVEGLLQGIIDMLGDPARLAKIQTSFITIAPKITTAIAKALPGILKILLDPAFWLEFSKQLVRSIWDAFKEMIYAIGDLLASIFSGDVFSGAGDVAKSVGDSIGDGIRDATKAVTGYAEQLFGVQDEQQAQKTAELSEKISKAFSAGMDKTSSWWDKLKSWFSDNWIGVVLAPFTMGLSLLFDNKKWMQFGNWLDENIFQPIIKFFKERWMGIVLAPFTLGLSLLFSNEEIEKGAKKLWDGITGAFERFGNWLEKIFSLPDWAKKPPGDVEKFIGINFPFVTFSEGGQVPGSAKVFGDSQKNDTVAALLSPGEFVIPRSKMQDKGNLALIQAIMDGTAEKKSSGGPAGEKWISKAMDSGVQYRALGDLISAAGEALLPDWLKNLWNSLKQYVSDIDFGKLLSDPVGAIIDAIKGTLGFITDPIKQMIVNGVKANQFANGGFVPGQGFTDSVPAMLTPGEFVINRSAAQSLGSGLLNQLNAGRMPVSDTAPVFNINLNIETKDALDANFIRGTLIPTIKNELKASSLRGDFVLSAKGVRS